MALAQLVTQAAGNLIKSGDWNNEFQNILTNPIALISPTTGPINFNLQAHTNLVPLTISASSGTAGQALVVSGANTVWGTPTVTGSGITVNAGTTGQVLAITSSNSPAAFQTLPIDGGLSTFTPTQGMVYTISSSAGFLKGITIGTSGQVLMVATSGLPTWQSLTSAGGSGGGSFSTANDVTLTEDFIVILSTNSASNVVNGMGQPNSSQVVTTSGTGVGFTTLGMGNFSFGGVSAGSQFMLADWRPLSTGVGMGAGGIAFYSTAAAQGGKWTYGGPSSNFASTSHFSYQVRFIANSTANGLMMTGFTTGPSGSDTPSTAMTGIYLNYTNVGTVVLSGVTSSGGSATLSAGVTATSWHTYRIDVSSSAVALTVDGASIGTITSSGVPNVPLTWVPGIGGSGTVATSGGFIVDYFQLISTNSVRV